MFRERSEGATHGRSILAALVILGLILAVSAQAQTDTTLPKAYGFSGLRYVNNVPAGSWDYITGAAVKAKTNFLNLGGDLWVLGSGSGGEQGSLEGDGMIIWGHQLWGGVLIGGSGNWAGAKLPVAYGAFEGGCLAGYWFTDKWGGWIGSKFKTTFAHVKFEPGWAVGAGLIKSF